MKCFFLGLLLYSAIAVSVEQTFRHSSQCGRSQHQVHGLEKVDTIQLSQQYRFEKRENMRKIGSTKSIGSAPAPQALKNAVSSLVRSFSRPTPSRSPSPASRTLEKSSSKRKDPDPLVRPTSQRRRISELSDITSNPSSRSSAKPIGKPPLHPSFKNTPEYKIKMRRIAASKDASIQQVRYKMHTDLPDASFLSDFAEHSIDAKEYPNPKPPVFSSRPPPFRSQAVDHSPGRLIAVS